MFSKVRFWLILGIVTLGAQSAWAQLPSFADLAEKLLPSVVNISTTTLPADDAAFTPETETLGSGFIISKDGEDVFQRDLEEEFFIRRSTATNILQLMERNGFIIRQPVDYDARLKKLVLTEKAVALHKQIEKNIDETERAATKGISKQELATFLAVIDKMKKNLDEYDK